MEKLLKIEATGSELLSFIGFVKEKDSEKVLRKIRTDYTYLHNKHGDRGTLKVSISTYNPELPLSF